MKAEKWKEVQTSSVEKNVKFFEAAVDHAMTVLVHFESDVALTLIFNRKIFVLSLGTFFSIQMTKRRSPRVREHQLSSNHLKMQVALAMSLLGSKIIIRKGTVSRYLLFAVSNGFLVHLDKGVDLERLSICQWFSKVLQSKHLGRLQLGCVRHVHRHYLYVQLSGNAKDTLWLMHVFYRSRCWPC